MAEITYRKISELQELEHNPRTISKDQFEMLKTSIQDNPEYFEARPIILSNRTGKLIVIAGNQRLKAAKSVGLAEVPTVLLKNLSEEKEREIIIRDNVSNGEWDMDLLANEWDVDELAEWGAPCEISTTAPGGSHEDTNLKMSWGGRKGIPISPEEKADLDWALTEFIAETSSVPIDEDEEKGMDEIYQEFRESNKNSIGFAAELVRRWKACDQK